MENNFKKLYNTKKNKATLFDFITGTITIIEHNWHIGILKTIPGSSTFKKNIPDRSAFNRKDMTQQLLTDDSWQISFL